MKNVNSHHLNYGQIYPVESKWHMLWNNYTLTSYAFKSPTPLAPEHNNPSSRNPMESIIPVQDTSSSLDNNGNNYQPGGTMLAILGK